MSAICYVRVAIGEGSHGPLIGHRRVRAEKRGEFALHRQVRGYAGNPMFPPSFGTDWTVTHRKTGFSVATVARKSAAVGLIASLVRFAKKFDVSWDFSDVQVTKTTWPEPAREEVQRLMRAARNPAASK